MRIVPRLFCLYCLFSFLVTVGLFLLLAALTVNAMAEETSPEKEKHLSSETLETEIEILRKEIDDIQSKLGKKLDKPDSSQKFVNKLSGLMVLDSISISQDDASRQFYKDVENNIFFRDLRFILKGEGYNGLDYECGIAIQSGLSYKNVALGIKNVPFFQNVRMGHFKVESGMNDLEAVIDVDSLTYNSNTSAFAPHRRIGIGATMFSEDQHLRWFTGLFVGRNFDGEAAIQEDSAGILLNTRLTGTPVYRKDDDGNLEEILHLGASFYWSDPRGGQDNAIRLRIHPTGWSSSMPYMLDGTVPLGKGTFNVTGIEIVWQKGQLGVNSESFLGSFSGFGAAYGSALTARYLLKKGSYRTYNLNKGTFASPNMPQNLQLSNEEGRLLDSWGDWELVAMWSYTDMENLKSVPHSLYGTFHEQILGVNWWWNPQLRWTVSWNHANSNATRYDTGEEHTSSTDTVGLQMNVRY